MKRPIKIIVFLICNYYSFAQTNACNCCSEQHQEFDFWIGEWIVTDANGVKVGENSIQKVQDNCVLLENWISAKGPVTGTSQNFFNNKTKEWEQLWIDNQGGQLKLKGSRVGNQMIMRTQDETNKQGKSFYHRITWTSNYDGTVRQLWETITNGENVTIAFDGLYSKKN